MVPSVPPMTSAITGSMIFLPPPPPLTQAYSPPIPPVISTDTNQAGQNFGRRRICTPSSNDSESVGIVSIQGQPYNGAIYDDNGNIFA